MVSIEFLRLDDFRVEYASVVSVPGVKSGRVFAHIELIVSKEIINSFLQEEKDHPLPNPALVAKGLCQTYGFRNFLGSNTRSTRRDLNEALAFMSGQKITGYYERIPRVETHLAIAIFSYSP